MPAQTQIRSTPTPVLADTEAPALSRPGVSNADAQARAGTADAPPPAPGTDARSRVIESYAARLWGVVGELMLVEDPAEAAAKARAVMGQAVEVDVSLKFGEPVDVASLPRFPAGDEGPMPIGALPPAWVQPARILLQMGGGSGASPHFQPDDAPKDLWSSVQAPVETPWAGALEGLKKIGREPADYGVPGYQTQSNNLAAPEATCNGTSLAMVLERLGYTREDLVNAIEARLKRTQFEAELRARKLPASEIRTQMAAFDPSCVALKDASWKARVLQYLRAENGPRRPAGYQRPRGATQSDKQLQGWAGEFKDNAGMDDLALFMMDLLGIERTELNSGTNADTLLDAVHQGSPGRAGSGPGTERVETSIGWPRARVKLADCLDKGGSAMLSIRHKGAGSDGTHIVAVQAVTSGGIIVDDPYGRARPDYSAAKSGDAYARKGGSRATSGLKNATKASPDDWKLSAPVERDEQRGESSDWSDAMVRDSWYYLMLFHRP